MPILPTFPNPNAPLDPRYVTFAKWLDDGVIDRQRRVWEWWNPATAKWGDYLRTEFEHIDTGLRGPSSPLESAWRFEAPAGQYFKVRSNHLPWPQLFAALDQADRSAGSTAEPLVWSVYSGEWRRMRRRTPHAPGGTAGGDDRLARVRKRVAELNQLYADGTLNDEQRDQLILEATREEL